MLWFLKKRVYSFKNWLIIVLSMTLVLSVTACGDVTSAASGQAGAAVTPSTVPVPTTLPATTVASVLSPSLSTAPLTVTVQSTVTTPPITTAPPALPTDATLVTQLPTVAPVPSTTQVAPSIGIHPVLKLSASTIAVGNQVTVNGSGFAANTPLKLEGQTQDSTFVIATLKTNEKGEFSRVVKLDKHPDGTAYVPGDLTFVVTNSVNGTSTLIILRIQQVDKAVLTVSNMAIKFGDEVTVTGTNFPANTEVTLLGGVQNPAVEHGKVMTDAQGQFSIKTTITGMEGTEYPYPYHFTVAVGNTGFSGYASVTVTDGSQNTLYLIMRIIDNQGLSTKSVIAQDVAEGGQTYKIDFSRQPNITLADDSKGTFYDLKPGNIIEFKGAPDPSNKGNEGLLITPLKVRVTQ